MATHHNFRIKNGLEVGGVLIVNSSGQLVVSDINSNQKFLDNVRLRFGNDSDYQIFHSNNGVTYLAGSTVEHGSNTWRVMNLAGTEAIIKGNADGNVELFHNGGSRFKTTTAGVQIPSAGTTIGWSNLANAWLLLGTSSAGIGIDNNEIMAKGVGSIYVGTADAGDVVFRTNGTSARLTIKSGGDVEVANNLDVLGDLNITGDINSVSVTDLDVVDKTITLGKGQNEASSDGTGILVDGPSTPPSLLWNETTNRWALNYGINVGGHVIATNNVYSGGSAGFVFGSSTSEGEYISRSGNDIQFYSNGGHKFSIGSNTTLHSGNLLIPDNSTIEFGNSSHYIQGGASHGGGDIKIRTSDDLQLYSRYVRFQDDVGSAGEYARIAHNGSWIRTGLESRHIYPQSDSSYNIGEVNKRYSTIFGDTGRFETLDIDGNVDVDGTIETDGLTVNNNPVYIRDLKGASVAGAGYYRVAANTAAGAGRGAFICTVFTTGGSYAPREIVIQGHADWSSTETIHTVKSSASNTYFTKARIVRESGDAFLEVYFYAAITDLEIETIAVGQAGWYSLNGALTAATGSETRVGPVTLIAPGLNTQEVVNATQGFQVNNQTVIDNSRNIENITTISTESSVLSGSIMDIRPSDTNQTFRVRFPDSSTMEMGTTRTGSGNVQKAVVYGQAGVDISTNGVLRASMTQAGDLSLDADCGGLYFGGSTRSSSTNAQAYVKESGLNLDIKGNDNVRLLGDGANVILFADYSGKVGIGTGTAASTIDEKFQVEGGNVKIEAGAVSTNRGLIIAHTGQTGNNTILEQYADGNPRGRLHTTERRLVIEAGSGGSTGTNEKLEFWTNASRAMTIDTSQKVGINNNTPQRRLTVTEASAGSAADNSGILSLTVGSGANTDSKMAFGIDSGHRGWIHVVKPGNNVMPLLLNPTASSNGKVGIGTGSNPSAMLDVVGYTGTDVVQHIRNPNTGWSQYALTRYGSEGANVRYMDFGYYRGSTEATRGLVVKSQANATLVTFLDNGNVGIGTAAPGSKLELRTDTSSGGYGDYPALTIRNDNAAGYGAIHFNEGSTQRARVEVGNNSGNPYLGLYTGSGSSGITIKGGNVGIATGSPASLLHVKGTQSYGSIRVSPTSTNGESAMAFFLDTAGTTTGTAWVVGHAGWGNTGDFVIGNQAFGGPVMLIQQDGNVGIGTTSPNHRFHVSGAATAGNFAACIQNSSGGGNVLKLYNHDWDDNDHLLQATNGGTSVNGYAFTVDGQTKVGIGTTDPAAGFGLEIKGTTIYNADIKLNRGLSGSGHHGINWYNGTTKKAEISWGESDANVKIRNFRNDNNDSYARIDFDVGGSSYTTNPATRMVIQNTGNVGIGTTSPSQKLEVSGGNIQITDASGGSYFKAVQSTNGANAGYFMASGSSNWYTLVDTAGRYQIYDGDASAIRVLVNGTGNVGIGTASPQLGSSWNKVLHVHSPDGLGSHIRFTDTTSGETGESGLYIGQYGNDAYLINRESGFMALRVNGTTDAIRIISSGNVGIANNNPGYLLEVGDASQTNSNIFSGRVNGDFIFNLSKASTNLFSIRNNNTSIVHLNTNNSATLSLGVSTTTGTGTIQNDLFIDTTAIQANKQLKAKGAAGFFIGHSPGVYERFFSSSYASAANQMYKLNLGNSGGLSGVLEITVQGTYSHLDVSGYVKRTTNIGLNQNGSIWRNSLVSVEQFGQAADSIVIGPVQWDSSASQYYVNIYKIANNGNAFTVGVRLNTHSATDGGFSTWTLSTATTLAAPTGYTSRYDTNARPQNVNRQYITDTSTEAFRVAGHAHAAEYNLPSGGMIDWANGDARIIEGQGENFSLSLQTYDGSAINTNTRFDGDNSVHHFGSEFSFLNNKIDMHYDSTPNGLSAVPTMRIGDFGRGVEELQFNVSQNGTARICFKDNNWSEGCYIKSNGETYGGKIYFGSMWNTETDRIVMNLTSTPRMGINNTNPQSTLHVGGDILATGNVTAYSDERLKDDLQPIENALSKVKKLRGVTYLRNDTEDKDRQAGLIAQDVEIVLPEAVSETEEEGIKTLNYNATIALLVESIKEQQTIINRLEKRVQTLENKGE